MENNKINQLIPLSDRDFGAEKIKTVNARDLWKYLESKRLFGNWIKEQIKRGEFKNGKDYVIFNKFVKKSKGRPKREYYIRIEMAKEIAQMSETEKGSRVRKYFIAVEKELHRVKDQIQSQYNSFYEMIEDDTSLKNCSYRITNACKVKDLNGLIYVLTEDKTDVNASLYRLIWNDIIYPIGFHSDKHMILHHIGKNVSLKKKDTPLNYMEIEGFEILAMIYSNFIFIYDSCKGNLDMVRELMKTSNALNIFVEQQWRKCLARKGITEKMEFSKHTFLKELFKDNPVTLEKARESIECAFNDFSNGQMNLINPMKKGLKQIINKEKSRAKKKRI